jgi:hypothetical protein
MRETDWVKQEPTPGSRFIQSASRIARGVAAPPDVRRSAFTPAGDHGGLNPRSPRMVLAPRVPSLEVYTHMFDEWEMTSPTIEEARGACGLCIGALWMAVVAAMMRRGPR